MPRVLAIAVLFASVLPVVGQSDSAHSGSNQNNATGAKQPPPPPVVQCTVKQDASFPQCNWAESLPEGYFGRLFTAENTPNIALFFVGFAGIVVALSTLKKIERQTAATEDAANAAYGSVRFAEAQWELTRDKERARLDIKIQDTELIAECAGIDLVHLIATFDVRNIGASRAFIRRTSVMLITKTPDEPMAEPDDYSAFDLPDQFIDPNQPNVPVKVYLFPSDSSTQNFAEGLEQGVFSMHLFGFIEYETLGLRWRKDFGYDWKGVDRSSGLGGLYGLSDPYPNSPMPAKDRITYGYWCANEEKDKPEYPISSE